jgi:hypothetical protein
MAVQAGSASVGVEVFWEFVVCSPSFTGSGVPGTGMVDIQHWAVAGFRCKRNTPRDLRQATFFSGNGSMH